MLEIHALKGPIDPLRLPSLNPPPSLPQSNHNLVPENRLDPFNIQIYPSLLELAHS